MANSGDEKILDELPDQTMDIRTDELSSIGASLKDAVLSANIEPEAIINALTPLTSFGIMTDYPTGLQNALDRINNLYLSASKLLQATADEHDIIDDKNNNDASDTPNTTGRRPSGSSSNNNPVDDTNTDNDGKDIDINTVLSTIEKLPYDSYIKFMEALSSIKGNLTEYLTDETKASKLLKVLLESPNIIDSFKGLIKEAKPSQVQKVIQEFLVSKNNVSDFAKTVITNYLESNNGKSNIEKAESKDKEFFNDVDSLYEDISKVLSSTDGVSQSMLDIYSGTNSSVSSNSTKFVKTIVDNLASSNSLTSVDILAKENEEPLKANVELVSKALAFFKTVGKLDGDISSSIFKSIIG